MMKAKFTDVNSGRRTVLNSTRRLDLPHMELELVRSFTCDVSLSDWWHDGFRRGGNWRVGKTKTLLESEWKKRLHYSETTSLIFSSGTRKFTPSSPLDYTN